ncbi:MAG: cytochrome c biogenesis protein CcdA, partial [Rhodospirillaceae bacterium]|nr:cytochrome c biogenesis protein CcdA [Rhodospirillaceae bacterium]
SEDSVTRGASLLAVYSAGLGIPFLAAALLVKPFMAFMGRARKHMQMVERVMGALLVITGIMFLTGTVADVAFWLLETFPALGKTG